MVIPYEIKSDIYFGSEDFYDPDMLGQMLCDGFIERDGDIIIPTGTRVFQVVEDFGEDDTDFLIGKNIYDLLIVDELKDEYLKPLYKRRRSWFLMTTAQIKKLCVRKKKK